MTLNASNLPKRQQIYSTDFSQWVEDQSKLLKNKEFNKLDIANLIEELESLGKSEKRILESYLEKWLMHMLMHKIMIKFQHSRHIPSLDGTIKISSHKAQKTLTENPSLRPQLKDILHDVYYSARLLASVETGFNEATFPEKCPWDLTEIFPNLEKKYC